MSQALGASRGTRSRRAPTSRARSRSCTPRRPPGATGSCGVPTPCEIPRDDASFSPSANLISATNSLAGGIRGGVNAPADFYSVTLKGVHEDNAVMGLLADGVNGYMARSRSPAPPAALRRRAR